MYILGDGGHAGLLAVMYGWRMLSENEEGRIKPGDKLMVGVGDPIKRREIWNRYPADSFAGDTSNRMPGHLVMPTAEIGVNVLLNTGCQIDHHCVIGDHCHIGPGAILCGNVTLGEACAIGAGAIIVQGVTLEAETYIPAGALVCGPDDIRRPVRDLHAGDLAAAVGKMARPSVGDELYIVGQDRTMRFRPDTDLQPQGTASEPGAAERSEPDIHES